MTDRRQHFVAFETGFDKQPLVIILERMLDRFGDHRLDLFVAHTHGATQIDNLFHARSRVTRENV